MGVCKRCNRKLKTPRSIEVGYGPVCKRKQDAADEEFLKIQVTMDEELAYQLRVAR